MRYLLRQLAFFSLLFLFFACKREHPPRPTLTIAYVGFHYYDLEQSKTRDFADQVFVAALRRHIDRINANARYGAKYQLKVFDCNFKEDSIRVIYQAIAADPNIALVLDNTWGKHLKNARDLILQNNLPVIALTADRNASEFGATLFLEPNDAQPLYLIKFIKDVLKQHSVGFITEPDYLLNERFKALRCEPECSLAFTPLAQMEQKVYEKDAQMKGDGVAREIAGQLDRNLWSCRDSVILLNAHSGLGNQVFRYFQRNTISPKTIIGLPGVTNLPDSVLDAITRKGHTIITLENNNDIFPRELYEKEQDMRSSPDTAFMKKNYRNQLRRCFDAMNIFETALQKGNYHRASLADYFLGLKGQKLSFANQLYDFDTELILRREPSFSQRTRGKNRSYPIQINMDGRPIPNLQVGLDIIDIGDIDIKKNAFECNLLYWVIAHKSQIQYESYIDFDNITANEAKKEFIAQQYDKDDSSFVVKIYRVSGKFSSDFEAFDFPFDRHELTIPISALSSNNDLRINFDYSRLLGKGKDKFKFSDWDTDAYFVTLDNKVTNRLGALDRIDTTYLNRTNYLEKYKSLNVHLAVSRRPWGALILIILPFLMFSMLPLFMLFFHRISFDDIGELIITSFLAAVAYSINLVQLSPTTDSLNRAYLFLLLALGINFLCFLYVTYKDRRKSMSERREEVLRKSRFGRISMPYVLLILFMVLCMMIFRMGF